MGDVILRHFRNGDVPAIVDLWNQSMRGLHCAHPLRMGAFERMTLNKLYFDASGLLLAEANGVVVGMAHAGFGPNDAMTDLDRQTGVISMVMVAPSHRRRGIGTRLMRSAQQHLAERGAAAVYVGAMWPAVPFYVGLYSGSEMSGVSDANGPARAMLDRLGYRRLDEAVIFRREVDGTGVGRDPRFRTLRRELDVEIGPGLHDPTWWRRQIYGAFEGEQVVLRSRADQSVAARASYWDMTEYEDQFRGPAAGLIDVYVDPNRRGQGVGRFLLGKVLDRLDEICIRVVEAQAMAVNEAAQRLYAGADFQVVDRAAPYKCPADELAAGAAMQGD